MYQLGFTDVMLYGVYACMRGDGFVVGLFMRFLMVYRIGIPNLVSLLYVLVGREIGLWVMGLIFFGLINVS